MDASTSICSKGEMATCNYIGEENLDLCNCCKCEVDSATANYCKCEVDPATANYCKAEVVSATLNFLRVKCIL